MFKKVFKCFVALVAIAAAATGPARAQSNPAKYATGQTVALSELQVGDTLCEGATINATSGYKLALAANRHRESSGVVDYEQVVESFPLTLGTGASMLNFLRPATESGQDGDAWVVSAMENKFEQQYVYCAGILLPAPPKYTVKMAPGTEDSVKWVFTPGEAATTGVVEGTVVNISYTGSRKVKDVVATVTYPEGAVSLATPLTIEAITAGTVVVNNPKDGMQYSLNGDEKTAVTYAITVAAGDKVAFYGNGTNLTVYDGTKIGGSGDGFTCKVYGNIMSLVDEEGYETATTLPSAQYVFYYLFNGNTSLTDASELLLPATTLANNCYTGMFSACVNLTAGPAELPATTLTNQCYYGMFQNCSGLTAAPALPATTLATSCYAYMFSGCSALTTAPDTLPATTLASACYRGMFQNCTTLVAAPVLPATTLTNSCYDRMFSGCSALTTAPDTLPATTLASACYRGMFQNCTTLVAAPVLPATTLTNSCYDRMFQGCSNLASVTCLATSGIDENYSTADWLQGVAASGTFRAAANAEWPTNSNNGIPTGWTRQNPDGSAYAGSQPQYYDKLTQINDYFEDQQNVLKALGTGQQSYNSSLTAAQAYALATYQAAIDGQAVYIIMSSQNSGYDIHYAVSSDATATEHTADLFDISNFSSPANRMYYVAQ